MFTPETAKPVSGAKEELGEEHRISREQLKKKKKKSTVNSQLQKVSLKLKATVRYQLTPVRTAVRKTAQVTDT